MIDTSLSYIKHKCFNRYIVECKESDDTVDVEAEESFNRYIVECKDNSHNLEKSKWSYVKI